MIDEGIIIEFMKHIKRQLYEEQARADNADHEGRTKDYFWHAGYISALKESLKEIERATGINGVYVKEGLEAPVFLRLAHVGSVAALGSLLRLVEELLSLFGQGLLE